MCQVSCDLYCTCTCIPNTCTYKTLFPGCALIRQHIHVHVHTLYTSILLYTVHCMTSPMLLYWSHWSRCCGLLVRWTVGAKWLDVLRENKGIGSDRLRVVGARQCWGGWRGMENSRSVLTREDSVCVCVCVCNWVHIKKREYWYTCTCNSSYKEDTCTCMFKRVRLPTRKCTKPIRNSVPGTQAKGRATAVPKPWEVTMGSICTVIHTCTTVSRYCH